MVSTQLGMPLPGQCQPDEAPADGRFALGAATDGKSNAVPPCFVSAVWLSKVMREDWVEVGE